MAGEQDRQGKVAPDEQEATVPTRQVQARVSSEPKRTAAVAHDNRRAKVEEK